MSKAASMEPHVEQPHSHRAEDGSADLESMTALRELDHRRSDGIDVRLLWDARTDRVSLALTDERSGEPFSFEVDPSQALSAFHHPFAHANDAR